jgi:membrane protein required for colicin V production
MTVLDYTILAILAGSAVAGILSGFLRGVVSLVTWLTALLLAWHFGYLIEPYLGGDLADPPFSTWAGATVIFLLVLCVGGVINAILGWLLRVSMLRGMDRFLGFLFGLARGVVIVGVLAIACQSVRLDSQPWWQHARFIPIVEKVVSGLRVLAGDPVPRGSFSLDHK